MEVNPMFEPTHRVHNHRWIWITLTASIALHFVLMAGIGRIELTVPGWNSDAEDMGALDAEVYVDTDSDSDSEE
jgi:hypothetical protein